MSQKPFEDLSNICDQNLLVKRSGNIFKFPKKIDAMAHRDYLQCLYETREHPGFSEIVLDFSSSIKAYSSGMIPLLCNTEILRENSIDVSIQLPADKRLQRLFLNTNWAHFIQPDKYALSVASHNRHLSVQKFKNDSEQYSLVTSLLDIVMRNLSLSRDIIAGLEWSINEITDNVLNHSDSKYGGFVQVSTFKEHQHVDVAVGDSGRGILDSLREGFPELQTDAQAIEKAVQVGVTRGPNYGQGNGLAGTLKIALDTKGSFELMSGNAQLISYNGKLKSNSMRVNQNFQGTFLKVQVGMREDFNLAQALALGGSPYRPVDIIETLFETDIGDCLVMRLKEESTGFGNRHSGKQLRTKCLNIMNSDPSKPMILDWDEVPLISSSFADEFLGKMFVELGPLAFGAKIRNSKMNSTIRVLVDKAIMQRMKQSI